MLYTYNFFESKRINNILLKKTKFKTFLKDIPYSCF